MKKLIALAGAAAMMLASTGVAFGAFVWNNQTANQNTSSSAISGTGENFSTGMVSSFQQTGAAISVSESGAQANLANINAGWPSFVANDQVANQNTSSSAISGTGENFSTGMVSSFQHTGAAESWSKSSAIANDATIVAGWPSFVANDQVANQNTSSSAISGTGENFSGGMFSSQITGTAYSNSYAWSGANWATITAY